MEAVSAARGGHRRLWIEITTQAIALGALVWGLRVCLQYLDPYREQREQAKKRASFLKRHLGRVLELNEFEQLLAAQVMNPDDIEVELQDVSGLEGIVADLETKVLYPMLQPELYCTTLWKQAKGVLLYGPPGTGKTMLAKALAKQSKCFFLNVTASSIMSKWLGDANRLVRAVFSLAAKLQPCIIFIDEVDAMLGKRGSSSEHEATLAVKTEFMQLWDGMESSRGQRVVVMGATNRPWMVDEAVLRRFTHMYEVGLPDKSQRAAILRSYLQKHAKEVHNGVDPELLVDPAPSPQPAGPRAHHGPHLGAPAASGGGGGRAAGAPSGSGRVGGGAGAGAGAGFGPLEWLCEATEGFSGSDLLEVCSQAAQHVLAEHLAEVRSRGDEAGRAEMPRPMGRRDLEEALRHVKPSTHRADEYSRALSSAPPTGGTGGGGGGAAGPMPPGDMAALVALLMQLRGGAFNQ